MSTNHEVRYEADERPPLALTLGLGVQYAVLALATVILTPAILISVAGESEAYLTWAVFAALTVSGIATVVQAVRIGRLGAGYILVMGSTAAFLPMSVTALAQGGPALLATLIVMSSIVQFILAAKMAMLRRIFTPTVAGTVLMLIPVSLAPIIYDKLIDVPGAAPPLAAPLTALPGPVAGAYLAVIVALLFVFGVKILTNDGLDYRKSLIVGVAFWVGLAFQFDKVYPELLHGAWAELLGQGMTAGGITVIVLSGFLDLTARRPARLRTVLSTAAVPEIDAFLCGFATTMRCSEATTARLRAVAEEALLSLLGNSAPGAERNLLLVAKADGQAAELEFIASGSDGNLEDRLAMLSEGVTEIPNEAEIPLRLLRHYATSVRHQQYHDTDIATIRIEPQGAGADH